MDRDPSLVGSARALAAEAWVQVREQLDRQLSPLGLAAIRALSLSPGAVVLDVGCGTGQTLLQLAECVGLEGRVIGVDIAPLVVKVAREQTRSWANVEVLEGDVLTLDLHDGSLDAVFSRFGVMAFPDPVAAFSNLRRMLKPSGQLSFVGWRSLAENELDALPLREAGLDSVADLTPFSFEDPSYIQQVLEHLPLNPARILLR